MLKVLKITALALLLAAFGACDREISLERDDLEYIEFFNPVYLIPESDFDQTCIVDVRMDAMVEREFIARIDRIADNTDNGIVYSNPVTRNRVVYAAPVDCENLKQKGAYSPTKYFNQVIDFKKTSVREYPYAARPSDYDIQKIVSDIKNAAVAAEFDFDHTASGEEGETQVDDLLCVSNSSLRAQSRFGLPFTWILAEGHSILYLYNTYSIDAELVQYLVESGLRECGAEYKFHIRALNTDELNYLSRIVTERAPPQIEFREED